MLETSPKPSVVHTFNRMHSQLIKAGLSEEDIITLIQAKTKPRQTKEAIRVTFAAIHELDVQLSRRKK